MRLGSALSVLSIWSAMGFVLALGLTSIALPSRCEAQSNPLIERGVGEYEDVRFEEALQTFSAALVRSGNTTEDLTTIYRYLALTYLALGRQEEATGAYRSLLGITPDYEPGSDVSPRFREFFAGVRTTWEADGRPGLPAPAPVSIAHRSPPQADRGTEVELEATLDDPDHRVASLVLAYRQGTNAVFTRIDMNLAANGTYVAVIPADAVAPPLVEYYFEAIDATGLPVASRGDVAAPLRIAVPAPGGDIAEEPGFWVAIGGGVLLVAGAIILGVVLGSQGGPQEGTLVFTIGD
jgi:tetratricopeptide (TPR) repeat protein